MNIDLSNLPRELFPQILCHLDDSTRAKCLSVCKFFQECVLEYEKPKWIEFVAKRRITVLGDDPRTQALKYLKDYSHFFYSRYPVVQKEFTEFPQDLFLAKQHIDSLSCLVDYMDIESVIVMKSKATPFNKEVAKQRFDSYLDLSDLVKVINEFPQALFIMKDYFHYQLSEEINGFFSRIDIKDENQFRFLLEQDAGRFFFDSILADVFSQRIYKKKLIKTLVDFLVVKKIRVSDFTIGTMIQHRYNETLISSLCAQGYNLDFDKLLKVSIQRDYSDIFCQKFLDNLKKTREKHLEYSLDKYASELFVSQIIDKLNVIENASYLLRSLMEKKYSEDLVLSLLAKTKVVDFELGLRAKELRYSQEVVSLLKQKVSSKDKKS